MALKNRVELTIRNNLLSCCNLGTVNKPTINTAYANIVITKFMKNISCAVRVSSSLLSRTCAQARIPYVGMPSCANIAKYEITDVAKETFPVPSGNKMRETYGKVMRGNMNCDIVRMAFMTKFNLSDFFIFYSLLPRSNITF